MNFILKAAAFPSDRTNIAFIISHLTECSECSRQSPTCATLAEFVTVLERIFQHTLSGREAARSLIKVKQGKRRVTDYAIDFRTLSTQSDWNNAALADAFVQGLSDKDQLISIDLPTDLNELIATAIKINKRLQERDQDRARLQDLTTDL